jgi:hypothetical protein
MTCFSMILSVHSSVPSGLVFSEFAIFPFPVSMGFSTFPSIVGQSPRNQLPGPRQDSELPAERISMVQDMFYFTSADKRPAHLIESFRRSYGPTINAFDAAGKMAKPTNSTASL